MMKHEPSPKMAAALSKVAESVAYGTMRAVMEFLADAPCDGECVCRPPFPACEELTADAVFRVDDEGNVEAKGCIPASEMDGLKSVLSRLKEELPDKMGKGCGHILSWLMGEDASCEKDDEPEAPESIWHPMEDDGSDVCGEV